MRWHHRSFGGANFWRATDATGTVRARVHATPERDFYWDVALVEYGFVIVDQGRVNTLRAAKMMAASIADRESRKQEVKGSR